MPIRAAAPTIKGTTRVSFGDKQLIKRLWIADKNSTQAKNQRSREINRADKERLTRTVQRKSIEAFQILSKEMRSTAATAAAFDHKEGVDDYAAVQAMCSVDWGVLCRRHERATVDFSAWCEALANHRPSSVSETPSTSIAQSKSKSSPSSSLAISNSARILARNVTRIKDVPLLHARKHKRACNFRARDAKRRELLLDYPQPSSATIIHHRNNTNAKAPTAVTDCTLSCDPIPRRDYERQSDIAYSCVGCGLPVCSATMVVLPNGAYDALYLHSECEEQRRALTSESAYKSLLKQLPFQVN